MPLQSLPLPDSTLVNYPYNILLSDVEYILKFNYRTRISSWYFSISAKDETPILTNCRLVPHVDLLKPYPQTTVPQGALVLYATNESYPSSPVITLDNLSTDFQLLYVT
jgi:hypothetical protein